MVDGTLSRRNAADGGYQRAHTTLLQETHWDLRRSQGGLGSEVAGAARYESTPLSFVAPCSLGNPLRAVACGLLQRPFGQRCCNGSRLGTTAQGIELLESGKLRANIARQSAIGAISSLIIGIEPRWAIGAPDSIYNGHMNDSTRAFAVFSATDHRECSWRHATIVTFDRARLIFTTLMCSIDAGDGITALFLCFSWRASCTRGIHDDSMCLVRWNELCFACPGTLCLMQSFVVELSSTCMSFSALLHLEVVRNVLPHMLETCDMRCDGNNVGLDGRWQDLSLTEQYGYRVNYFRNNCALFYSRFYGGHSIYGSPVHFDSTVSQFGHPIHGYFTHFGSTIIQFGGVLVNVKCVHLPHSLSDRSLLAGGLSIMPAKKTSLMDRAMKEDRRQEQQQQADREQEDLQRRLRGDTHGLQEAASHGKEEQERRAKHDKMKRDQEATRARNAEEARALEESAQVLVDGIKRLGLQDTFPQSRFTGVARPLHNAFSKGPFRVPTLGNMSLHDFTQRLMYGVRASVFKARTDEQDRGIRVMRALDPKAQAREGLTRIVVAENQGGSGLEATVVLNKLRELLPSGGIRLGDVRCVGGPYDTSRPEIPVKAFVVDVDSTLTSSGDMLAFLRTAAMERIIEIGGNDGGGRIETLWTVESGFDVHVVLLEEESRCMARAFSQICSSLQIDKSTRDSILTECVRNSPGMAPWKDDVLGVRLQMESNIPNRDGPGPSKSSLHEFDWGQSGNRAPKVLINVCSSETHAALVRAQPQVRIFLGMEFGDLVAIKGTISGSIHDEAMAGLAQARERIGPNIRRALEQGEEILQRLQVAGGLASEGKGTDAAHMTYECKLTVGTTTDAACLFLREKIEDLVKKLESNAFRLCVEDGRELMTSIAAWRSELHTQRASLTVIMAQLKFFPDVPPAILKGAKPWWMGRVPVDRLRSRLQATLGAELEAAKILCVEPILNQYGQWSHSEGVLVALQSKEGLMQRCQLHQQGKQGNILTSRLNIWNQGAAKAAASLRVVWMSAPGDISDGGGKVDVKAGLRALFVRAEGIWIPKQVSNGPSTVTVYLRKEDGMPPPTLSSLGDSHGEYDIRNLHTLLDCSRDEVDGAVETMGSLLDEGVIAPVCEYGGMTLFIAKEFAVEFLAEAPPVDEANLGCTSFLLAVKEGAGVRESILAQLGSTLCPLLLQKLDAGVWMLPSFQGGIQGTAPSDKDEIAQSSCRGRWWYEVLMPHVLAKNQRNDLAEAIIGSAMYRGSGIQAIRKGGGVLLVQENSFWLRQLVEASEVIPGSRIPTETLQVTNEDQICFEMALWPRAAALGSKWEICDEGTEGINRTNELPGVVQALKEDIDSRIPKEVWMSLPPINYSTQVRVGDVMLRPDVQGTAIVFVPYSGEIMGIGRETLLRCRAEDRNDLKPTTRIFTTAQLLPTWDVATFGSGAARILQAMANEGRATILRAVGGYIVVMAERAVLHGYEVTFNMQQAFGDPTLMSIAKGTLTQASPLRAALETASLRECKQRLMVYFSTGKMGVLAGTRVGEDGLLRCTAMTAVKEEICLRRIIQHPALCDSRGLRVVEEIVTTLELRAIAVGCDRRHLLIGMATPNNMLSGWRDEDPRFLEWNPEQADIEVLLTMKESEGPRQAKRRGVASERQGVDGIEALRSDDAEAVKRRNTRDGMETDSAQGGCDDDQDAEEVGGGVRHGQ